MVGSVKAGRVLVGEGITKTRTVIAEFSHRFPAKSSYEAWRQMKFLMLVALYSCYVAIIRMLKKLIMPVESMTYNHGKIPNYAFNETLKEIRQKRRWIQAM